MSSNPSAENPKNKVTALSVVLKKQRKDAEDSSVAQRLSQCWRSSGSQASKPAGARSWGRPGPAAAAAGNLSAMAGGPEEPTVDTPT